MLNQDAIKEWSMICVDDEEICTTNSARSLKDTGLGLTIVYQVIVSSLGGAIDLAHDDETVFNLYILISETELE